MALEAFDWKPSTSASQLNHKQMNELCSTWIAENLTRASSPANVHAHDIQAANDFSLQPQRPSHFLVWTLGLSFVTIISLCALVGILFMRLLQKKTFNKFITFFVSVGVGSLSGSAVFHLLPQAFGLVIADSGANHAYLSKAFAAVVGIYLFFFSDKLIKIVLETRKRNKKEATELARLNAPTVKQEKENGVEHAHGHGPFNCSSDALIASHAKAVQLQNSIEQKSIKNAIEEEQAESSFIRQAHSICVHDHDMQYKEGDSVIATVAWMIIFGDGLHNFIDGISIGASFSESILSGISVSVAVLCEEFPHELGDVAILVSAGMTLRQALVYNLLSAMSCYVGFVIGVVVGNVDESFAAYTFGFAGGMFLYISMSCMMPEMKNAMEEALSISLRRGLEVLTLQALGVFCGLVVMAGMARYGGEITFQ